MYALYKTGEWELMKIVFCFGFRFFKIVFSKLYIYIYILHLGSFKNLLILY